MLAYSFYLSKNRIDTSSNYCKPMQDPPEYPLKR